MKLLQKALAIILSFSFFWTDVPPIKIIKNLSPPSEIEPNKWMQDVFLVISDITDTLIDKDNPELNAAIGKKINELLALGVVFVPLTGMGRGTLQKRFFDKVGLLESKDRIAMGVQNGGSLMTLESDQVINSNFFPQSIRPFLRTKVQFYINQILREMSLSEQKWAFQPSEPKSLKSILYTTFEKKLPKDRMLEIASKLEAKLFADAQIKRQMNGDKKLPFSLQVSDKHIILSARNKVDAVSDIVDFARSLPQVEGDHVLILANSGGDKGQDGELLLLKKASGLNVKGVYVGRKNKQWAKENQLYFIPQSHGPEASLVVLDELIKQVKKKRKQGLVKKMVWSRIDSEYKEIIERSILESPLLENTIDQFFGLKLYQIEHLTTEFLGRGGENYATSVTVMTYTGEVYRFLLVVPHRKLTDKYKMAASVDTFLAETERVTLEQLTEKAKAMPRRNFPLFGDSYEGVFTRELFEGEEIGKVVQKLSKFEDLEQVLYASSLAQIDFWHYATDRSWIPMVHDDDIIVNRDREGSWKAYLPDLGTPMYHAPPFRLFMDLFYLNYELIQIYNEAQYGRHVLLRPHEIRIIFQVIIRSFMDSLGELETKKLFAEILMNLESKKIQEGSDLVGFFHFSHFALRFYIEKYLEVYGIELSQLPYMRPNVNFSLDWANSTPLVDRFREHYTYEELTGLEALKLPRPYNDNTKKGVKGGDVQVELMEYKANAKTFERISEIALGILNAPLSESMKIFEEIFSDTYQDSYTYNVLILFKKPETEKLKTKQMMEVLYGLFQDFDLTETIPGDWMRLYRLVQLKLTNRLGSSPFSKLKVKNRIENDLGKNIFLQVDTDLGKEALLWHSTPILKNVHAFNVFVEGEFAGVIVLSYVKGVLVLERFRLNRRGRGLGKAIVQWVQNIAIENKIEYLETFEFTHFIHLHVLKRFFPALYVLEENKWKPISEEEAQKRVIVDPTGYRFRFKVPLSGDAVSLDSHRVRFLEEAI